MSIRFRPPFEAGSFLLEVTEGCSHNRCSFCTMYRDQQFRILSIDEIEEQLFAAKISADKISRVFLENGDAFALSAEKLSVIAEMVHSYFPKVRTISMYASVKNIIRKSDSELKQLASLGIGDLNIGIESGYDKALKMMEKGYSAKDAEEQLLCLKDAGISFCANIILGAAGSGSSYNNARETAKLLNRTKPYLIFTGTIHADEGCPLYDQMKDGRFEECTFEEYFYEEEVLLNMLELPETYLFGLHPSNVLLVQGKLGTDKDKIMKALYKRRKQLAKKLDQRPVRISEGTIIENIGYLV